MQRALFVTIYPIWFYYWVNILEYKSQTYRIRVILFRNIQKLDYFVEKDFVEIHRIKLGKIFTSCQVEKFYELFDNFLICNIGLDKLFW